MLYCPDPSVATERTFSISAELAASTVTPGSTPPDASRTVPAIVAASWAKAPTGNNSPVRTTRVLANLYMPPPAIPARRLFRYTKLTSLDAAGYTP